MCLPTESSHRWSVGKRLGAMLRSELCDCVRHGLQGWPAILRPAPQLDVIAQYGQRLGLCLLRQSFQSREQVAQRGPCRMTERAHSIRKRSERLSMAIARHFMRELEHAMEFVVSVVHVQPVQFFREAGRRFGATLGRQCGDGAAQSGKRRSTFWLSDAVNLRRQSRERVRARSSRHLERHPQHLGKHSILISLRQVLDYRAERGQRCPPMLRLHALGQG